MEIEIQLFIQEHHDGFYSLEVVGDGSLRVYTPDLDKGREDLYLVLSDRIERTHPKKQSRYVVPEERRCETIILPEALNIEGVDGVVHVETEVSVVITKDRKWQRLWFPRWNCHYWASVKDELEDVIVRFLSRHLLKKMSDHERLEHRSNPKEWLETLTIEAEPPSLEAFVLQDRMLDMLPVPTPKEKKEDDEDNEEDEEKEEAQKKKGKKQKRPPTPTLKRIGVPLHRMAKDEELERAFGRKKEVEELFQLLLAPGGTSIAVIGVSGVGKTTILNELVYRLRQKGVHKDLRTKPVWFVDASRLVAGEGSFGGWQRQCLDVIQECMDAEVIWYIGNLLPLLDAGKHIGSDQNVSYMLRSYLANKRLTVIGECTPRNWAQLEVRDVGFARLFTPYRVEEPDSDEKRREILKQVAKELEEERGLTIGQDCLDTVDELSRRYSADGSELGNTVYFLRRLADDAFANDREKLGRLDAIKQFCSETGLPEFLVRDDLPLEPDAIWSSFRKRLIGQHEAIRKMTDLVSIIKAGLSDLQRPLGSFLFVGPTGVGKTEMAKALCQYLFGRSERLLRFDMSEFISPASIHRFLGDANQEGKLISAVRRSPFSVLLLDEIEKAHSSVFDVLLQVLGEARLTDEAGRTADFRNVVVLMTSNLGVSTYRQKTGFGEEDASLYRQHFISEAERFFRPEFFNRIDYVVPFVPLEREAIDKITTRELEKFMSREGVRQGDWALELGEGVPDWLSERGVDPRYGARPLKRVIEQQLNAPLARYLSDIRVDGNNLVKVQIKGEVLDCSNIVVKQKKTGQGQVRGRLRGVLEDIGVMRFLVQRWTRTGSFRELSHSVRLFERLSRDSRFWKDREVADKRAAEAKKGKEILEAYQGFQDQVSSLEDLAFEAYYDRNVEPLEFLTEEVALLEDQLTMLETRLFAERFESPHTCVLYFAEERDSGGWLRELLRGYLEIAERYGWKIQGYASAKVPLDTLKAEGLITDADIQRANTKQPSTADAKLSRLTYELDQTKDAKERERILKKIAKIQDSEGKKAKKKVKGDYIERLRWRWHEAGSFAPKEEDERKESIKHHDLLDGMFTHSDEGAAKALVFQGEYVACMLYRESGTHDSLRSGSTSQVKMLFADKRISGISNLEHPMNVSESLPIDRKRLHDQIRAQLQDTPLQLRYRLENRWFQTYCRFMRASIYYDIFGPKGLKWFDYKNKGKG